MARKGRGRKAGRRYANGRRVAEASGDIRSVAMAQPHRRGLRNIKDRLGKSVDARLDQRAESVLGLLFLDGTLDEMQFQACAAYAGVVGRYRSIMGIPHVAPRSTWVRLVKSEPNADDLEESLIARLGPPGDDASEAEIEDFRAYVDTIRQRYTAALDVLELAGELALRVVAWVAILDRQLPDAWFPMLINGADALARHFRLDIHRDVGAARILTWAAPAAAH